MMTDQTEGMDPDLYDSGGDTPKPDAKPSDKPDSVDQEEAMNPTTLVDMKILTGKDGMAPKVGEERVVKVVAVHGDQAEIEYAPEKPDAESPKEDSGEDPELDSINSKY